MNLLGKLGISIVFLVLALSFASASVEDLVSSYDFSFNSGEINITSVSDIMVDSDSDSVNDTLSITVNFTINVSDNYFFQITLEENGTLVSEGRNKTFSSNGGIVINISSTLLTQTKFNYSLIIYDSNNVVVFRQEDYQTQNYSNYQKGVGILNITDENNNNNVIRINLTLNITQNSTDNVTIVLAYNNKTITSTEEETLTIGTQIINIDFDNETIKSTHYNGTYLVDSVAIGDKSFDTNHTTSVYNYEDFAKTTYIKSFTDRQIDNNSNNLSEYLEINLTIEVKSDDNFTIEYELYDEFDNFATSLTKNTTLTTGTRIVQTLVNGSEIYKSKVNGPYVLKFIRLSSGSETVDLIFDAYTTNSSSFDDFEQPPLPDLTVIVEKQHDDTTNSTNVNVTITNRGEIPSDPITKSNQNLV